MRDIISLLKLLLYFRRIETFNMHVYRYSVGYNHGRPCLFFTTPYFAETANSIEKRKFDCRIYFDRNTGYEIIAGEPFNGTISKSQLVTHFFNQIPYFD